MIINGSWKINNRGLEYDREWVIVNSSNGTALTQKHETRMCLIKPVIDLDRRKLRLEFDGMESIELPLENKNGQTRNAKICETKVCGDRIQGVDCGDEFADWLNRALSATDLRLIQQNPEVGRKNGISLSNQAQFLLVSEPSVLWLMNNVEEWDNEEQNVENIVSRFRGNLVIDDLEPLAETEFKEIRIGKLAFNIQGPCTRCQMICIDQTTGQKTTEPLRTIGKLFKGKMRFGIYLSHVDGDGTTLQCGDEIYFTK